MRAKLSVAAMILLALTACAPSSEQKQRQKEGIEATIPDEIFETQYKLKNGRTVTCLVYDGSYAGGLSCDWSNAR